MPNHTGYYPVQWDDTTAEQGDACPEGWGNEAALDHWNALAVLEEQARQERAVVRENTRESAA